MFKNTLYQVLGKTLSTTLGVIITVLLTRYLGPSGYGQYTFVLVFVTLFGVIGDWGLTLITIREASRDMGQAPKLIGNVLVVRLFLAVVAITLSILASFIMPYSQELRILIMVASLYLLALSLKTSFQIVFNIKLKLQNWAISEVVANAVALTLILTLISLKASLLTILWAFNLGHFAAALAAAILALRLLPIEINFKSLKTKYLLWEALPMGTILVIFTIYNRIDTLILAHYQTDKDVGIYGAAYRIYEVLTLGAAYFTNSILPTISKMAIDNRAGLKKLFRKSFFILVLMGILVAITNYVFAPIGIMIVGGEKFQASVVPLRILSLAVLASYVNHLTGFTLVAMGKQWTSLKIAIVALLANVILNLWLIPIYSYQAAAFTTFLTEGLIVIISLLVINHELKDLH